MQAGKPIDVTEERPSQHVVYLYGGRNVQHDVAQSFQLLDPVRHHRDSGGLGDDAHEFLVLGQPIWVEAVEAILQFPQSLPDHVEPSRAAHLQRGVDAFLEKRLDDRAIERHDEALAAAPNVPIAASWPTPRPPPPDG